MDAKKAAVWSLLAISVAMIPFALQMRAVPDPKPAAKPYEPDETGLLSRAVWDGDSEAVIAIIEAGVADVNAKDLLGSTPLHDAAAFDHPEIVIALINAGANPNASDHEGSTPLHKVAFSLSNDATSPGYAETIAALLAAGADPNANDDEGSTPLHLAALFGNTELVIALLAAGANPNAKDENGSTPLHLAPRDHNTEIIVALLAAGADPNETNEFFDSPALDITDPEMVDLLRHAQTEISSQSVDLPRTATTPPP